MCTNSDEFVAQPPGPVRGGCSTRYMEFTTLGASATRAFGINAHGAVVGTYIDAANSTHAFVVDGEPKDNDDDD